MGKFIIHKVATGFTFQLQADNHETIAISEVYSSEAAYEHGIDSVRHNCAAHVEDQTQEGYEPLLTPNTRFIMIPKRNFAFA